MLGWRRFGVVIVDDCSSGGVLVLLLLMSAHRAATITAVAAQTMIRLFQCSKDKG